MDIELSQLTAAGLPIRGPVRLAPEEPADASSPGALFPEPFDVDGRVRRVGDLIIVTGLVSGTAHLTCGRCLARVVMPLRFDFEARYAPQSAAPKPHAPRGSEHPGRGAERGGEEEGGVRLEADDLDMSFLAPGTHALVIEDIVREQVLLELPLRPLCKEDCRGLCPRCGDDLNAGECRCGGNGEPKDLRFAALAEIKKKLEKN